MARRGRSKRDVSFITTGSPVRSINLVRRRPWSAAPSLLDREDGRSFHPLGLFRPAATVGYRSSRRVVVRGERPEVLGFAVPGRVVLCVRRQQRRQVLHALNRLSSGRGARKRRNEWSDVSCRS